MAIGELERPRILICSSGAGTTTEAIIHATQTGILHAEIAAVVTNNSGAGVLNRVTQANLQYGLNIGKHHISNATHPRGFVDNESITDGASEAIEKLCIEEEVVLLLLSGYMKKFRGPALINPNYFKLNHHPAPLPETRGFIGLEAQIEAMKKGLKNSAAVLHVVEEEYDTGTIVAEHPVPIMPGDTPEIVFEKVRKKERRFLPIDINKFLHGERIAS